MAEKKEMEVASENVEVASENVEVASENAKETKKKVEVYLPRLREEKNQDVWVCVNGKGILIKRGERVMVDPEYAEVLKHSEQADDVAYDYLNKLEASN